MLQKHLSNHDDCHHCQKIQMRLSKWCCWLVGRGSENLFYTWDFPISGILQQQLLLHKDESQKKKKNWKEAILDNNRQCVISRTFYWVLPGSSIDTKISPHRIEIVRFRSDTKYWRFYYLQIQFCIHVKIVIFAKCLSAAAKFCAVSSTVLETSEWKWGCYCAWFSMLGVKSSAFIHSVLKSHINGSF